MGRKKKAFKDREGRRWEMALVEERRERRENKQALKKWEGWRERENKKRESLLYLSAFQFARHIHGAVPWGHGGIKFGLLVTKQENSN